MADPAAVAVAAKRTFTVRKVLALTGKIAVTCGCLSYVVRQIKVGELLSEAEHLDVRWLIVATLFVAFQGPLVGIRWGSITNALKPEVPPQPLSAFLAINMIATFFAQILPNVMSDALRVWFLTQIRRGWRDGLVGVVIDRGVGVASLLGIGLAALANASAFTALSEYRPIVLATFAVLLFGGVAGLIFAPLYAPLLARLRVTQWIAELALTARQVLIESPTAVHIIAIALIVHALSIVDIWCLGRAFSMSFDVTDAATLFTLIVGITLIPITVNGWGLRELAVTAFLNAQGISQQRALLFSICFGMTFVVAALPGAIVLVFYSSEKTRRNVAHSDRGLDC